MDEELWEDLDVATKAAGTDRSAVLREFARWYIRERGAKLPRRPPPSVTTPLPEGVQE